VGVELSAPDPSSQTHFSSGDRPFTLRLATPSDISAILALEQQTESAAHWPENTYREMFVPGASARIAIVVENAHQFLCGLVIARVTSRECELENIAVAHNLRRRGAGALLIHSLLAAARERHCDRLFLEVRESNLPARSLYEKCGFKITGRRPRYYSNPVEDALLYSLEL